MKVNPYIQKATVTNWSCSNIVAEMDSGVEDRPPLEGGYQDIMWPRRSDDSNPVNCMATIGLDTSYSRIHNTRKKVEYTSAPQRGIIMVLCFLQYWLRSEF